MAANALNLHGKKIRILHNTEAKLRAEMLAANKERTNHKLAQTAKSGAAAAVNNADQEIKQFLANVRRVLGIHLRTSWNPQWQATGFPQGHGGLFPFVVFSALFGFG